ncbi:cytochrome c oxidase subunit 3 [soil metagenome]
MSAPTTTHASTGDAPYYFIPAPSKWPIVGSIAMFCTVLGAASTVNHEPWGVWTLLVGFAILTYMFFGWFGQAIGESQAGLYSKRVDNSFRWSMSWFIFSEVMFFAAFFGALFYARVISSSELGALDARNVLWPDFNAVWPNTGPAGTIESWSAMSPLGIPTLNTALLLTSGITITWAHHALIAGNRRHLILGMLLTVLLGVTFLGAQAYEYIEAYSEHNLKLTSGVFGSTFYLLTGFHGFHVTVGTIMLITILVRCMKGHFTPEHHFAFEGVAWYWHFVDVVWLGLYVVVYWL